MGVLVLSFAAPDAGAARPIRSAEEAVLRLRKPDLKGAVRDVKVACRGRHKKALRDHPQLVAEVQRLIGQPQPEVRMRALDTYPCFSKKPFIEQILVPRLYDRAALVVAYSAEVAGRLKHSGAAEALLERLKQRKAGCLEPGLPKEQEAVCIRLTDAAGRCLSAADRGLRVRAGQLVAELALLAPNRKLRAVSVKTLVATRLKTHAQTIRELVVKEKKGAFKPANSRRSLRRFAKQANTLARRGE